MSEWWSYGLSDFLMFSPEAYWRLVARYNAAWWPAQAAGVAAAGLLLALATRVWSARAALLLLACGWAWTGWAFYAQRYAEIFLGAGWLALAAGGQALLLAGAALLPLARRPAAVPARATGAALLLAALLYPLLAPLTARAWSEAEVFGWMPDPTALATLGTLLALAPLPVALRLVLALVPLLVLLLGGVTRWLLA